MEGSKQVEKDTKLMVIEQRLSKLYSKVEGLEELSEKLQGTNKPTTPTLQEKLGASRALSTLLVELPDQLGSLSERIEKTVNEIMSVVY